MKTKKRILKIAALTMAILLIVGVLLFANSLVGNPISKSLAKNTAEKHLQKNYANTDFELERVSYSFKDRYYHAYVSSPSSTDSSFDLVINGLGKLQYDDYEYNIEHGWNTANRLRADYRKTVETVVNSTAFQIDAHMKYGELMFASNEYKDMFDIPDYALITEELTLDAYYNVNELGKRAGKLTVYLDDKNITAERLAQVLLDIRACFDSAGVGFYAIDCVMEYPRDATEYSENERIEVMDFLYSDIYEEGLTDRVLASNEAAQNYYYYFDKSPESEIA